MQPLCCKLAAGLRFLEWPDQPLDPLVVDERVVAEERLPLRVVEL